jgi:adenosylcobyric acid synthase
VGTRGVVLFGTGASSGKTLVSRALCRLAWRSQLPLRPYKAVSIVERPTTVGGRLVDLSIELLGVAAGLDATTTARSCTFAASEAESGFRLLTATGAEQATVPLLCRDQLDWAALEADRYGALVDQLAADLRAVAARHPVLVEGSASPTDAPRRDLANHEAWRALRLPIVLVTGAQGGGCAAALVGTLRLLPPDLGAAVRGFVVNGVTSLPRGRALGERVARATGVPCLGVVPRLQLYEGLPERGADHPVVGSWDEETDQVADALAPLWDPVRRIVEAG